MDSDDNNSSSGKKSLDETGGNLLLAKATDTPSLRNCCYVSILRWDKHCTEWFKFHPGTNKKRRKPKIFSRFTSVCWDVGLFYAASGSFLYCVGGTPLDAETGKRTRCKNVRFCDLSCPEDGFRSLPQMSTARCRGNAVVLQRKLFVFGGCHGKECFGEYYDLDAPGLGKWVQMDLPESLPYPHFFAFYAVAYDANRIFVVFNECLENVLDPRDEAVFLYNIESNSWEACDIPDSLASYINHKPVIVDGTLIWISGGVGIFAYDIPSQKFSEFYLKEVTRIDKKYPPLIHLGGIRFCTITIDKAESGSRSVFRVLIFQLSKTSDGSFDVLVESTPSYPVEWPRRAVDFGNVISLNCLSAKMEVDKFSRSVVKAEAARSSGKACESSSEDVVETQSKRRIVESVVA